MDQSTKSIELSKSKRRGQSFCSCINARCSGVRSKKNRNGSSVRNVSFKSSSHTVKNRYVSIMTWHRTLRTLLYPAAPVMASHRNPQPCFYTAEYGFPYYFFFWIRFNKESSR